jgi:hypothetical protein
LYFLSFIYYLLFLLYRLNINKNTFLLLLNPPSFRVKIFTLYQNWTDTTDVKDRRTTVILRELRYFPLLRARIELTFLLLQSNALTVEPSELDYSKTSLGTIPVFRFVGLAVLLLVLCAIINNLQSVLLVFF